MEFRDYYTTLGVARTATDKEIRSAYRKLARELHPDVNKDPRATERVKRVNEAYEVLKDPEKRAKYDRLGADWEQVERAQARRPQPPPFEQPRHGARFGGFSDFFETFFGNRGEDAGPDPLVEIELERLRREQNAPRRGQDSEHRVEVTLREAATGSERTMQLSIDEECPTCHGTGRVAEQPAGGGTAVKVEVKACPTCQGTGRQTRRRSLKVTIPRGVTEGSRVRVSGEGRAGPHGGARGDLYLRVHLDLDPGTEVRGRDVYTDLPVRDYRAALGGRVATRDPAGGGLEVTIPSGTASGRTLRVPGKGIPSLQAGGTAGDLYLRVRVSPSTRTPLPEGERDAYRRLEQADSGGG